MDYLIKLSDKKAGSVSTRFERYIASQIDWHERLIVIRGQRGSGKTTLVLQQLRKKQEKSIYMSLDNIYFEANRLVHTIEELYESGYRTFYLDEVHRYHNWSKDLKNIYDNYADIQLVCTGSSVLEIDKGQEDLSRRAVIHELPGLSFREYLNLREGFSFEPFKLDSILESHQEIALTLTGKTDIVSQFRPYLKQGYYPYFMDGWKSYPGKLREATQLTLDLDIAIYEELNASTLRNMKKLMYVISQSVPFKPNISKLSQKLDIPRNTILKIFDLLDRAGVLMLLRSDTQGVSYLQKPEKVYLQNTNLLHVFAEGKPSTGNIRETFFLNQLKAVHSVTYSRFADFMVDNTWTFEVGGPSKTREQIRGVPNAWIASDGIVEGQGNKVPLWLFGFLY